MKKLLRKYLSAALILLFIIAWALVLILIPPSTIVAAVGPGNTYLVGFIVALVAGFSAITGTTAYATIIEFARGGADPLLLGAISGIGLFISDAAFYALALRGRRVVSRKWKKPFAVVRRIMDRIPDAAVYVGVFAFAAFGPIPNDVLLVALIVGDYEFKRFWPFLLAGDLTFMLFLSYIFQP
ncbi:MAG: hypothetical protein V4480_00445 [Patescibacteria group bacterium]